MISIKNKILLEYIKQSPNRQKVIKSFQGDAMRPTQISIATGIHISSVSKCLRQLREKELIYLLNPDFHIGRLYDMTETGKFIAGLLEKKKKRIVEVSNSNLIDYQSLFHLSEDNLQFDWCLHVDRAFVGVPPCSQPNRDVAHPYGENREYWT